MSESRLKRVTVLYMDGRESSFEAALVTTEIVQWKITYPDGALELIPMINVRTLTMRLVGQASG